MTKADKQHLARVASLGCIVCGQPAIIHHITGNKSLSQKNPHSETIPLCPKHHKDHGHGISLHDGVKTWEAKYGTQRELLEQVREMLR